MKAAYIVWLHHNEKKCLQPSFSGGDPDYCRDEVVDGLPIRGMTLEGYFQLRKIAPPDFVKSAPTHAIFKNKRDLKLDFGMGFGAGLGLACETFVKIVSELEPNANQYIKIENTTTSDGNIHDKKYFLVNVTNNINAINISKSNVELREISIPPTEISGPGSIRVMRINAPFNIVLDGDLVAGRHVWRGTSQDISKIFISDELKSILDDMNLKYLQYQKVSVE